MATAKRQMSVCLAIIVTILVWAWIRPSTSAHLFLSPSSLSSSRDTSFSSSFRQSTPLPTKLLSGSSGFHVFESLYLRNGTLFLLSPPGAPAYNAKIGGGGFKDRMGRELLPLRHIISTGKSMSLPQEERDATPKEIQVLAWKDRSVLGVDDRKILLIDGTTMLLSDPGHQFMAHYYHLWAELLLGAWKAITLASNDQDNQFENIKDPRRLMFPNSYENQWRDPPGLNSYILKSVFPSLSFEHQYDWEERAKTDRTYMFEKVVIADRSAGSNGDKCVGPVKYYWKMMANVFTSEPNPNWFKPIRQRLLDVLPPSPPLNVPVVTYISRQGRGRALRESDHDRLVDALEEMAQRNGWVLEVPTMEKMSKDEQFKLAARTTVMVGVHGNGLTHQIWMDPSPFSTVIEIFIDKGVNYDYALPAEALGHRHFALWSDGAGKHTVVDTVAEHRTINFPEGFHDKDIRVDGPTVVKLIEERMKGWTA